MIYYDVDLDTTILIDPELDTIFDQCYLTQ